MFIREISIKDSFFDSDSSKYPFNLSNIRSLINYPLKLSSNIIFFVGENGSGKTTFLESIANHLGTNRYGGSKNFKPLEDQPLLTEFITLIKTPRNFQDVFFFRAETFFNLQKELEEYNSKESPLHHQYTGSTRTFREFSHGQGFKQFFINRIRKNGLYFFDEPESALSPESQIELLFLLREFESMGTQIFIVTHSPILLSYPHAQIFEFGEEKINEIVYEETVAFRSTKRFLDNYKRYQKELLKD